ncbi:hypothetical protein ILYODFUR_000446 [Ilyodon furcidens]|uniref:Uncharacterized protein n=1 Tax=Ilyodon furcidens TaxID=33524 RepID=A0ABV0T432_9TELE
MPGYSYSQSGNQGSCTLLCYNLVSYSLPLVSSFQEEPVLKSVVLSVVLSLVDSHSPPCFPEFPDGELTSGSPTKIFLWLLWLLLPGTAAWTLPHTNTITRLPTLQ